jgi:hypothetical protein
MARTSLQTITLPLVRPAVPTGTGTFVSPVFRPRASVTGQTIVVGEAAFAASRCTMTQARFFAGIEPAAAKLADHTSPRTRLGKAVAPRDRPLSGHAPVELGIGGGQGGNLRVFSSPPQFTGSLQGG